MSPSIANQLKRLGIGRKIEILRNAKHLTLSDTASRLGISEILLQQIENDSVPPTVATLLNIAKLLGVGIDHFFTDEEEAGKIEVTRVDERLTIQHDTRLEQSDRLTYNYESLAYRLAHKHMEPFFVEFVPQANDEAPLSHDGEEFIYVVDGELDFISGDTHIRLCQGDSLYFYAQIPHTLRAVGHKNAKAIIVLYPYAN